MPVRKDMRSRLTKEEWKRTVAYREKQELIYKIVTGVVVFVGFSAAVWVPSLVVAIVDMIVSI